LEKEFGQIKITETDDGFRIDISGKNLKELFSCCGGPMFKAAGETMSNCCSPGSGEKK
jgi:hypothetical protein